MTKMVTLGHMTLMPAVMMTKMKRKKIHASLGQGHLHLEALLGHLVHQGHIPLGVGQVPGRGQGHDLAPDPEEETDEGLGPGNGCKGEKGTG